jgi:hypothetical protein
MASEITFRRQKGLTALAVRPFSFVGLLQNG